jgi:pimeloyl-ACP methyl ester carboxylesterase
LNGWPTRWPLVEEATLKSSVETRAIIAVSTADGLRLRGTYHLASDSDEDHRVGVLFVSAGVAPRAAPGDSAVHWADALAKLGYPSFRFDLPGLGDSDGDLSAKEIDFDSLVNEGAFGPVISGVANELADRFSLRGVVVIGHCAGAVTALYSAAANSRITGLILLDPYFNVQQTSEPQNVLVRSQMRIAGKLVTDRPRQSIVRDALLSVMRNVYYRLTPLGRLVRPKKLPAAANSPLVNCWKQLASSGRPMLVLRSSFSTPKLGEFDYIRDLYPLSDSGCRISVKLIERATHAFAERGAKEQVLKHTEPWLSTCFPHNTGAETQNARQHAPKLAAAISGVPTSVR